MLFKEKIDKVVDVERIEREFEKNEEKIELEKNDLLALFIASFLVLVPAIIFVIGGMLGLAYLFFYR